MAAAGRVDNPVTPRFVVVLACLLSTPLALDAAATAEVGAGPPRAAARTFDFTRFEATLLPQWAAQFGIGDDWRDTGRLAFTVGGSDASMYAAGDVAHALAIAGQLNLTAAQRSAWAATLNGFMNASGFFELQEVEHSTGFQPWHATGFGVSSIRLLGGVPAHNNSNYAALVSSGIGNHAAWEAVIRPLLDGEDPGCSSVWDCAHKAAAIPAVLAMEADAAGHRQPAGEVADFLDWYFQYTAAVANSTTGVWCAKEQWFPPSTVCVGGAFHLFFVYDWLKKTWPNAAGTLQFSKSLQRNGEWHGGAVVPPGFIDVDGIYQILRPAAFLGKLNDASVRASCVEFLTVAEKDLNDASIVLGMAHYSSSVHGGGLVGAMAAVAECFKWFPDMFTVLRPWVQVLDVAPYI